MSEITRRETLPLLAAAGLIARAGTAAAQYGGDAPAVPVRAHLGVTENPFGPSPAARRAIAASVKDAPVYPHGEAALTDRIRASEGLGADQIGLASGSLDALSHLTVGIARGGRVVSPAPTYATHLAYAARQGIETDWVRLAGDHQIDLGGLLAAIGPQTKLAYVCNPNNPTGLLADPEALAAFCIAAAKKVPVLVDEAYFELAPDPARQSMARLVRDGHDVIVARTFSKVYGLAGLRIGYVLGQAPRVKMLRSLVTTSRNQAGLAAAAASFGDAAYLKGAIAYLADCRERIYRVARANGLAFLPSIGTYVYVNCGQPARAVQARLAALGVEVRLFDGAGYENWMRIGTATPADIAILGQMLPRALKG